MDSGRLLGAEHLKESLLEIIKSRELKGGKIWAEERLIGRLRYMAEEYQLPLVETASLDDFEVMLKPDAEKTVFGGYPCRSKKFHINALLDDIAFLKCQGLSTLDFWWLRLGWENEITADKNVIQQVLNEHFRRLQMAYKEVVENSFKSVAGELGFYLALPVRWDLAVVKGSHGNSSLYHRWLPVLSWDEIRADTQFSETTPELFLWLDFSQLENSLKKFGRSNCQSFSRGGFGPLPSFNGYSLLGMFDGETSVVREVCDLISDDVKRLFSDLPTSD